MKNKLIFVWIKHLIKWSIFTLFIGQCYATQMMVNLPQWELSLLPNEPSLRGSAVSHGNLWVTGTNNAVFISTDLGKTWIDKSIESEISHDFRDIEVFDSHTAIAMGVGEGANSVLYLTTNQGDSWTLINQNTDQSGFYDSIGFWSRDKGLILGDPVDDYYVIKKTEDGGQSWKRIPKHNLPPILVGESAFAASGNTLIVGDEGKAWFTTGGKQASLYSSDDFGESWQRLSLPLYQKTSTAGGYGLHQKGSEVFVVGGDYKQRDGQYINLAKVEGDRVSSIKNGGRGLRSAITCEGAICISTGKLSSDISYNYGRSWQPLLNQSKELGFYTLASKNMLFLAAGDKGKVAVLSFQRTVSHVPGNRLRN